MTSTPDHAFRAAHDAMLAHWPVGPEDVWLTTPTGGGALGPESVPLGRALALPVRLESRIAGERALRPAPRGHPKLTRV